VVRDEYDFNVLVFGPQEAGHPKEEAAGDILLELAHRSRRVPHGKYHGGTGRAGFLLPDLEPEIIVVDIPEPGIPVHGVALQVFHNGALLVEVRHGAGLADFCELDILGGNFLGRLGTQVGQAEIFKDQLGEVIDRDFCFVEVPTRRVANLLALPALLARAVSDHIAHLGVAVTLADLVALVRVEAEAILLKAANRDFDQSFAVGGDDRFLGDDLRQVLLDRLFDLLVVPCLVLGPFRLRFLSTTKSLILLIEDF
jgi:hypothetical protein